MEQELLTLSETLEFALFYYGVCNDAIFDIVTNFNQPEFTNQSSSIVTDISRTLFT
jgi:hypothetical protein